MTLSVVPEVNLHIVNAKTSVFRSLRDFIVCNALWTWHAAVIGSIDFAGSEPCPPCPSIIMFTHAPPAIIGPDLIEIEPSYPNGALWYPYTSSTPSKQPSSIIFTAPPSASSAG